MTAAEMPETYWAWVAGVIDGEGSYCVSVADRVRGNCRDKRVGPKLVVVNTDLLMLEKLAVSGGSVKPQRSRRPAHWRPTSAWRVGAGWIREFGPRVLPYAVTKRAHLGLLLEALAADRVGDALLDVRVELKRLNGRSA